MRNRRHKHKFNAISVMDDGHRFPSKKEHAHYRKLLLQQKAGEVIFFLRQVPIHLPGGIKYVIDFLVFYANGDINFEDVKGFATSQFILKKKLVEAIYPIEIDVLK